MSIFNFIRNYEKAKQLDRAKKALEALNHYISYSLAKGSTNQCIVLRSYVNDITEDKDCSEALLVIKDTIDKYHRMKMEAMIANRDKLKAQVELLELKKCQQ